MRVEHAIDIAAPPREIWGLTVDIERWPAITPTVTAVERLDDGGPITVGSTARLSQPGQPDRTWTVTELEPERRFAWSTKTTGMTMTGVHEITETDDGATQTLIVVVEGPLAVLGPLLRRPLRKAITTENEGFKRAAEAA